MLMKYKDFKQMSNEDMKQIQGGSIAVKGCYAVCGTMEGVPHGFKVTVPVGNTCSAAANRCAPYALYSCSCTTYGGGNPPIN